MEQADLEEFRFYEGDSDQGTASTLICAYCKGKAVKEYRLEFGINPSLRDLLNDAAAHFAAVHRKTDDSN